MPNHGAALIRKASHLELRVYANNQVYSDDISDSIRHLRRGYHFKFKEKDYVLLGAIDFSDPRDSMGILQDFASIYGPSQDHISGTIDNPKKIKYKPNAFVYPLSTEQFLTQAFVNYFSKLAQKNST